MGCGRLYFYMLYTLNYNIQTLRSGIINNIFIQSFITYYTLESSFEDGKPQVSLVILYPA